MLQNLESDSVLNISKSSTSSRRQSTFYVPLIQCSLLQSEESAIENSKATSASASVFNQSKTKTNSKSNMTPPCGFDWRLTGVGDIGVEYYDDYGDCEEEVYCRKHKTESESISTASPDPPTTDTKTNRNVSSTPAANASSKSKRYGVVMNGVSLEKENEAALAVAIDDVRQQSNDKLLCDEADCEDDSEICQMQTNTSTPIKLMKSRSRTNILSVQQLSDVSLISKSKSKTLPHNMTPSEAMAVGAIFTNNRSNESDSGTFPPKNNFLVKSTPRLMSSSTKVSFSSDSSITSPKKSLSFIRRENQVKLTRSNSILKSIALIGGSKQGSEQNADEPEVHSLALHKLENVLKSPYPADVIKEYFEAFNVSSSALSKSITDVNNYAEIREKGKDVESDTSYEKACRRGSVPLTSVLQPKSTHEQNTTSKFTNFFSRRTNALKRTKSVTKLERTRHGPGGLRGSRSHESLLSNNAMSVQGRTSAEMIAVAPVHQSVLGKKYCFQVRSGQKEYSYYSCGSRQERDLWIHSLRDSIAPNGQTLRHKDHSLKMWIFEAKNLPSKKKYFCEINLDKTMFGRTSVKMLSDLLFWGEYFDFTDIPDIQIITVNVFREIEKKKKRDKHSFIGSIKIPVQEVTSRVFFEDWYPIKSDDTSRPSKESLPTLRIKCRFQSIDVLPIEVYNDFLNYLNDNYKKLCDYLEPVIGVKAKEDIGQALVLLMYAQGKAGTFLSEVVALDLLRVGDERLTFRGNSLATKSMEAFLKLTGEQYLQDTLSASINEIINSDRDCEVDPMKTSGSLSRKQQTLRKAVAKIWQSIFNSYNQFPLQLKECFAAFRDKLQSLNRSDMIDNLISASIFLRFICPAILSPSLFNITNEFPSTRAARNLTLVAKTLQTLANFTRFQGKEDFMEFLNDFLDGEAPRMKEFLSQISKIEEPFPEGSVLNWSGYIDKGKQLSILATLLTESIQKLPQGPKDEMKPLFNILSKINDYNENTEKDSNPELSKLNDIKIHNRGVIKGTLTPITLETNIFTYNDPNYKSLHPFATGSFGNKSKESLNNSHQSLESAQSVTSLLKTYSNASSTSISKMSLTGSATLESAHKHISGSNIQTSPITRRPNTIPRNIPTSKNDGNEVIHIGLDSGNAFVRKSPTPLLKGSVGLLPSYGYSKMSGSHSLISLGSNTDSSLKGNVIANPKSNPNSNMPMSLEDLDDLLKYAEEHGDHPVTRSTIQSKEQLLPKTTNIASHYNTASQSRVLQPSSSHSYSYKEDLFKEASGLTHNQPNHLLIKPQIPLAFKNPTYQMQQPWSLPNSNYHSHHPHNSGHHIASKQTQSLIQSSKKPLTFSLTPSSSEENLNAPGYNSRNSNNMFTFETNHNSTSSSPGSVRQPVVKSYNQPSARAGNIDSYNINSNFPLIDCHRRLSLDSARTMSDSSTDTEVRKSTDGKRRRQTRLSEQCEIQRLQASLDSLRQKLDEDAAELQDSNEENYYNGNKAGNSISSDFKMRSIIDRLITMEEDLRKEQMKMSMELSAKQRVIEAQDERIAALDAANSQLLSQLSALRHANNNSD